MSKPKLWTKDFLVISGANFFIYFTFYLLMVTSTLFATKEFNGTPSQAGLASGIFVIGTLIARLFAGNSIDRIGWKKTLFTGALLFFITTCMYFFVSSLSMLMLIRFINGAAYGIASTATGTIVTKIIPHERHGEGIGYYGLSITLAGSFGPFVGMAMQRAGFNATFTLCTILLLIGFIALCFLRIPKVTFTKEYLQSTKGFSPRNFFEFKSFPIAIVGFLVAFGYSSILTFLTPYTEEINLVDVGSFFFIVYVVAILVSRPFTGRWFDTKGENFVIYPSFVVFAIALVVLSQAHHGITILIAGALVGLGFSTFVSSAQASAIKVAPSNRVGLATSTFFIFLDGGIGVGPFILGLLIPMTGYRNLYIIMAVIILLTLFLYYFLHGKNISKKVGNKRIKESSL
ncbi:MFS transporter [Priestia endophytica]|uniref:MFS transporter n=1 Tax=Priestia endophytica TaxID=135735 RepID=UPI000F53681A|nr:MFS transporter [Priestia endophytica]RPK03097.1 hypothetical protein FH5_02173 [Priestia endophytica]